MILKFNSTFPGTFPGSSLRTSSGSQLRLLPSGGQPARFSPPRKHHLLCWGPRKGTRSASSAELPLPTAPSSGQQAGAAPSQRAAGQVAPERGLLTAVGRGCSGQPVSKGKRSRCFSLSLLRTGATPGWASTRRGSKKHSERQKRSWQGELGDRSVSTGKELKS